jgi:hypothetical protein
MVIAAWLPTAETVEVVALLLAGIVGLAWAGLVLLVMLVVIGLVLWRG